MKKLMAVTMAVGLLLGAGLISGCGDTDADVAGENLSKDAEQFRVDRKIVFFNGITDKYLLVIEGRCSIETDEGVQAALSVTCKTGPKAYKKHYLGLSDNVSYFVEQTNAIDVSVYHYKVIFKPETVVPNIDRP